MPRQARRLVTQLSGRGREKYSMQSGTGRLELEALRWRRWKEQLVSVQSFEESVSVTAMNIKVIVEPGEDGYFVAHVPSLKSCWSQGKTKQEALQNIREAIEVFSLARAIDEGLKSKRTTRNEVFRILDKPPNPKRRRRAMK